MTNIEKIKSIFEIYYTRDEESKKEKEDFLQHKEEYELICESTYDAILEIEKKMKIQISEYFKDFLNSKIGLYIAKSITSDEFRFYDENELHEFNYIGKKAGYSAIEELKDFLIIGQDDGECSYFLDVKDKLGMGIDAVWQVNRSDCEDFVMFGENFIDFLEGMATNRKIPDNDFFNEDSDFTTVGDFLNELKNDIPQDKLLVLDNDIKTIYKYIEILKKKDELFMFSEYFHASSESLMRIKNKIQDKKILEIIYILIHLGNLFFTIQNVSFETLILEKLEEYNIGKRSKKYLSQILIFAVNTISSFKKIDQSRLDYFFIDYKNTLGNGSDAIYFIGENSKKITNARFVTNGFTNFFKIFAEESNELSLF